jgi:hypothetical protein
VDPQPLPDRIARDGDRRLQNPPPQLCDHRSMTSRAPTSRPAAQVRAQSLERWSAYHWRDGIQIPDAAPLDRLLVRTRNHVYDIIVLDPRRADVLVRGGVYFPEFTRARVGGSSMGGGFLKLYGIHPGFCLELHADDQAIVTSPVREISRAVEHAPL